MSGDTDNGTSIQCDERQAWNTFNSPQRKRLAAVRPVLSSSGSISYEVGVGFDFRDALAPSPTTTSQSNSLWDVALWDVALWSPENQIDTQWRVRGGTGQNLSPRIRVNASQDISWLRTDFRIEIGSGL